MSNRRVNNNVPPEDLLLVQQATSETGEKVTFLPTNFVITPQYYTSAYQRINAYYTMMYDLMFGSDTFIKGMKEMPTLGVFMMYIYYMQNPILKQDKDGKVIGGLITASDLTTSDKKALIQLHDALMGIFNQLLGLELNLPREDPIEKALNAQRKNFYGNEENIEMINQIQKAEEEHFKENQNEMLIGKPSKEIFVDQFKPEVNKYVEGKDNEIMNNVLKKAKELSQEIIKDHFNNEAELLVNEATFDKISEAFSANNLPLLVTWDQLIMVWPMMTTKFVVKSKSNNRNSNAQEVLEDAVDREVSDLATAVYYFFVASFIIKIFTDQYGDKYPDILPRVTILLQAMMRENIFEETKKNQTKLKSQLDTFNKMTTDDLLTLYIGKETITDPALQTDPLFQEYGQQYSMNIPEQHGWDPTTGQIISFGKAGSQPLQMGGGGTLLGFLALVASTLVPVPESWLDQPVQISTGVSLPSPTAAATAQPSYPMFGMPEAQPNVNLQVTAESANPFSLGRPPPSNVTLLYDNVVTGSSPVIAIPSASPSVNPFALGKMTGVTGYTSPPFPIASQRPTPPAQTPQSTPLPYSPNLARSANKNTTPKNKGKQVNVTGLTGSTNIQVQATPTPQPAQNRALQYSRAQERSDAAIVTTAKAIGQVGQTTALVPQVRHSPKVVYNVQLAFLSALETKGVVLEPQHIKLAYDIFSGSLVECGSACSYTFQSSAVAYTPFLNEAQGEAIQGVRQLTKKKVEDIKLVRPQFTGVSQATSSSIVFESFFTDVTSSIRWETGGKEKAFDKNVDTNVIYVNAIDPDSDGKLSFVEVALEDIANGGQTYALGNVTLVFELTKSDQAVGAQRTALQKVTNAVKQGVTYLLSSFDQATSDQIYLPPLVGWSVQFLKNNGKGKYNYHSSTFVFKDNSDVFSVLSRGFMMKQLPEYREALVNTPNLDPRFVDIRVAGLYGNPIFTMSEGSLKDFMVAESQYAKSELKYDLTTSMDRFAISVNEYANHKDPVVSEMAVTIVTNVKRVQSLLAPRVSFNAEQVVGEFQDIFEKYLKLDGNIKTEAMNKTSAQFKALALNITNAALDPLLNAGAGLNAVYQSSGRSIKVIGQKTGSGIESATDFVGLIMALAPSLFMAGAAVGFVGDFLGHAWDASDVGIISGLKDVWVLKNLLGPSLVKGLKVGVAGAGFAIVPPVISFGLINASNIESCQPFILSTYILLFLAKKFGKDILNNVKEFVNTIKDLTRTKTEEEKAANEVERKVKAAERSVAAAKRLEELGIQTSQPIAKRQEVKVPPPPPQNPVVSSSSSTAPSSSSVVASSSSSTAPSSSSVVASSSSTTAPSSSVVASSSSSTAPSSSMVASAPLETPEQRQEREAREAQEAAIFEALRGGRRVKRRRYRTQKRKQTRKLKRKTRGRKR